MPIEIKELIIRAVADQGSESLQSREIAQTSFSEEALVEACVKQVLRILKKEKER